MQAVRCAHHGQHTANPSGRIASGASDIKIWDPTPASGEVPAHREARTAQFNSLNTAGGKAKTQNRSLWETTQAGLLSLTATLLGAEDPAAAPASFEDRAPPPTLSRSAPSSLVTAACVGRGRGRSAEERCRSLRAAAAVVVMVASRGTYPTSSLAPVALAGTLR